MRRKHQNATVYRCDCCRGHSRNRMGSIGVRRRAPAWVLDRTREVVLEAIARAHSQGSGRAACGGPVIFKEQVAGQLKVPVHQVAHALHRLNLEGLVQQPVHRPPHDSKRDRFGGRDSAWAADYYPLNL